MLKGNRRRKYPRLVACFPKEMASEVEDLIGKPAVAHRDGNRLIITFFS